MQKFFLSVLLCAGIVGAGNPMKRKLEDSNKQQCPYNEIVLTNGQTLPDNNELTFDFNMLLNGLNGMNFDDITGEIICRLDVKSFLELTQASKQLQAICNNIPIKYLMFITCADAAFHGNAQLTSRFLIAANECKESEEMLLMVPTVIQNLCSQECVSGKIDLCKVLIGNQQVYKTSYRIGELSADSFLAFIDMGNQTFILLLLKSRESCNAQGQFSEGICNKNRDSMMADLAKRGISDQIVRQCLTRVTAVTNTAVEEYLKLSDENDFVALTSVQMIQGGQDVRYSTHNPNFQGSEKIRSLYLNHIIILIIAAHKNHAAVVKVFLQEPKYSPYNAALELVLDFTTSDEIQDMIHQELNRRNELQ